MRLRTIRLVVGGNPWNEAKTWSYPNSDGKVYVIPTYRMTVSADSSGIPPYTFEVLRFGIHRTKRNLEPRVVGIKGPESHTIKRWIPTYKVHSFPSREDGAWQVRGNYLIHDGPDSPLSQLYATAGCIEICGGPDGFTGFNIFVARLAGSEKPDLPRRLDEIGRSGCMHIKYQRAELPPIVVWR